ncbi:MAG: precorrin-6Y C5,15-methyltransferase (decarboxylating) subunit CbiT [Thermincolia bacterium]
MNKYNWQASTPGIPDSWFTRDQVPMTKEEIRVITLAKLRPQAGSVIWDVGAGTGSLSIEAALCAPKGHVFAIERNPAGVQLIKENQEKFGVANITVVDGSAPQALIDLPKPDRVMVGGSGGSFKIILEHIDGVIVPRGRVVINAILLDTLSEALNYFQARQDYNLEIIQVGVTRVEQVRHLHMLQGQNPVFIITAEKVGE